MISAWFGKGAGGWWAPGGHPRARGWHWKLKGQLVRRGLCSTRRVALNLAKEVCRSRSSSSHGRRWVLGEVVATSRRMGDLALILFQLPVVCSSGLRGVFQWMSFPWTHTVSPFQLSFFIEKIFSIIWLHLSKLCLSSIFKSQCQHHHHYKVFTQRCTATNNRIYGNNVSFLLKALIKIFFLLFYLVTRWTLNKSVFLQVRCILFIPRNLARCLKVVEGVLL